MQCRNVSFAHRATPGVCNQIPLPHKGCGLSAGNLHPTQRTGFPPACASSWPQRHKLACMPRFVLESAFSVVFYHHCQLFQDLNFILARESRHWKKQTQVWQMKNSRKRPGVKLSSVAISFFSCAPLTATFTVAMQDTPAANFV